MVGSINIDRVRGQSTFLRYGLAMLAVPAATTIQHFGDMHFAVTPSYFCAVVLTAWLGGLGPGLFAVALSILALMYYFVPPTRTLAVDGAYIPSLILFSLAALFVTWLSVRERNATKSLADARDQLDIKICELEESNKALLAEIAACAGAEQALRESEYKLRQIIDTVPSFLWSADPTGAPTYVNQRALDYSGMRLEDFMHGGWEAFIHPDDFPETQRAFEHAIKTGESFDAVHRLRRSDGEYRWRHACGEPLRDPEGRIIQWYGLSVDIDDARKAEDQLRRSEAYLAEAQRISHTGSWAWDPVAGQLLYWSDECYRIWGFDPVQSLPDRGIAFHRIHPDDRSRVYDEAQEALRQKRDYRIEFRIVLPDGTVKHLESIGHHLFSARGELAEVIGTNIDVTERESAQEEIERLRQLETNLAHMNRLSIMGELAASLAHEIKQPIAAARTYVSAATRWLDRSQPDLAEARAALAGIADNADRASRIIDRIRDNIKKAPQQKTCFDLSEAINEVIGLARSQITNNGVSVQTRLAQRVPAVNGDRVQLQQVLLNLILNAVEAMASVEVGPRELTISTEHDDARVLVAVRDSGPGIDTAQFERIFQAFYTTKSSGTGMGLSICRSIIDAHGGKLWAEAGEPHGAVFQFTLPGGEQDLTSPLQLSLRTTEPP